MQIHKDFDLSQVLWFRIGGKAKYFLQCSTREDILKALDFVEEHHPQRIFICGLGSNLIFTDDYFDGVVIQIIAGDKPQIRFLGSKVTAFGGETLDTLIQLSLNHELQGLEWAGGLPGTVGAGVRGNVGAFGGEIKDRLIAAEVLEFDDKNIDVLEMKNENFHFSYRHSVVKEKRNMIVTFAQFELTPAGREEVIKARATYAANKEYRRTHHPIEYPNCGSVFKNIKKPEEVSKIVTVWPDIRDLVKNKWHGKVSMGYVINRLGFPGYKIGGAEVSTKHSNFINNMGGATAKDVLTIIKRIQEMTSETFAVTPEVEVEIVK
ncbi:MAG TPA: UDP-N-acetylmuramate dehydrogenase [Candidatus Saccharimonadales bacterium]|nr:UDP-N-acetylmuramate dehydrogenase [Candidatus Saccharimonadales bacterium]